MIYHKLIGSLRSLKCKFAFPSAGLVLLIPALNWAFRLKTPLDVLARSTDPLYELAFRLVGTRVQDRIWTHVLTSLAEHLNTRGEMQVFRQLVDADPQWKNVANIRYNAQIRTILHILFTSFRWIITGSKDFFQSSINYSPDQPGLPARCQEERLACC